MAEEHTTDFLLYAALCYLTAHLLGGGAHLDDVLNAVVQEVPGVQEVRRGVLQHHQLGGVVDARQCRPLGVPVHLQQKRSHVRFLRKASTRPP